MTMCLCGGAELHGETLTHRGAEARSRVAGNETKPVV